MKPTKSELLNALRKREPQVRCDDWLGEPNKSGAPLAEKPAARSGVGGENPETTL